MPTPDIRPAVIHYQMYEGDEQFVGTAQITLPTLNFETVDVTGAGIMGTISTALIAQMRSMQIQIQFLTLTEQGIHLAEHKIHTWEFREAQQSVRGDSGEHYVSSVKHVMRAFPVSMDGGTLQPHSASNSTITANVYYWAIYRDGVKVLEVDPFNYICFINGTDYAAQVRAALKG